VEMFIYALVMIAISYAMQPKPPKPKPQALSESDIPIAQRGMPIPVVFGTLSVRGPNVVWYGDLKIKES
jgi:hypothetical protein